MHCRARHDDRQYLIVGQGCGGGKVAPVRVFPRASHQIAQDLIGHIGQHQAGEDFVHAIARAQNRRDEPIGRAADDPGGHHRGDDDRPARRACSNANPSSTQRAHHILAFRTDVPDFRPVAHRKPQGDDDQRRRLQRHILPFQWVQQRGQENIHHGAKAVDADQIEHDHPDHHGDQHRGHRRCHQHEVAGLRAFFQLNTHGRPPQKVSQGHRDHHEPRPSRGRSFRYPHLQPASDRTGGLR